ncbi:Drug/metabolite transporter [Metarhizium brunneum]
MDSDRRPNRGSRSGTPLLFKAEDHMDEVESKRPSRSGTSSPSSQLTPNTNDTEAGRRPPMTTTTSQRSTFSRQSTMHSRNPASTLQAAKASARKKYLFAAFFLSISLVAFCIQTELSAYIQHDLAWGKAYCMMYLTHSSWIVLWPMTFLVVRLQKRHEPWDQFWRKHLQVVLSTVTMIELQTINVTTPSVARRGRPVMYLARMTIYITSALTIAGLSWYIAVSLTTPSDLTAIYNCSAFFAYAFSVPILKEPLRVDKSIAVMIAILGVLVVAYGDTGSDEATSSAAGPSNPGAGSRFAGNLVIGVGSVLYGLYEVLYKRYACPPEGVSPVRGTIFANVFGSCIGFFTLTVLWIPLPFLHWLHIERFEIPNASTCWLILLAVLSNATFSGCFLVLISLTSPVLSSVAALLTIFIVALADWFLTGQPLSWAAIMGGSMIIVAFAALSWSTYREMMEHEAHKLAVDLTDDDEGDMDSDRD